MKNNLIAILIFIISLCIILPLVAISPQYFDAAEYVLSAVTNSIPHQPGYPWFMIFAKIIVKYFNENPYFSLALFSTICHILAGIFIFLSGIFLTKSRYLSIASALAFIFYSEGLKIAVDAEVFGMHHLLISLIFFISVQFYYLPLSYLRLVFLGFLLGVASSHHQTIVLWFPFILFLIYIKSFNLKTFTILFISGLVGLSGNLSLFLYENETVYKLVNNFSDLIFFIRRGDYGSLSLYSGISNINYGYFFDFIFLILKEIPVFLCVIPLIIKYAFKDKNKVFIGLFLSLIFHFWFIDQFKFPEKNISFSEIALRFSGVLVLFFVLSGLLVVKYYGKYHKIISILILLPLILNFSKNLSFANSRTDLVVLSELNLISKELPPNSVFFSDLDRIGMGMLYQNQVNNLRKDLTIIHISLINNKRYQDILLKKYPEFRMFKEFSAKNLTEYYLKNGKEIYTYFESPEINGYWKYPVGVTWKIIPSGEQVAQDTLTRNMINHCFNLPKSIFIYEKERNYSDFIVENIFLKPFEIYEKLGESKYSNLVNKLRTNIISKNYDITKQTCNEILKEYNNVRN